jgi:hypothetical protein
MISFYPVCSETLKITICKTVLVLDLCWYEKWSFTLREEHNLQVFEDEVPRKIFGHNKIEVINVGEQGI